MRELPKDVLKMASGLILPSGLAGHRRPLCIASLYYCTVPAAAVVLGGPGCEGDACGEVAALLVLVVALLGRHRREPRAAPAPPEHSELFQIMNIQWAMNG